ncbi:MAG: flavodoxin family protein [Deltaproteobacteria bacterium]|nr:flavodoxin family protein [Deltaproteobacteria bacterium]MBW2298663.1 flavodoxin family protein [Deltaproteobacteria bacterium]
MKVLGIYGSPRKGGNSDQLLDKVLEGAQSAGAEVKRIYARDLKISGCQECGGCEKTGKCVVNDEMQTVYPLLEEADVIFLASPIFFYGLTAQIKAIVDRAQAMWSKKMLKARAGKGGTSLRGRGYLVAVGATRGKNLFEGAQLTARYFFDALEMSYEGEIFFRRLEKKTAAKENPEALQEAFNLGLKAVSRQEAGLKR